MQNYEEILRFSSSNDDLQATCRRIIQNRDKEYYSRLLGEISAGTISLKACRIMLEEIYKAKAQYTIFSEYDNLIFFKGRQRITMQVSLIASQSKNSSSSWS